MPAKDAQSTIKAAIQSTLRAMPDDAELLVFDDASSDNTADIVRLVPDTRVKLFASSDSRGVAQSLNHLLSVSAGRLIARMDADDVTFRWRFNAQKKTIDRGIDVSFGSVIHFGDSLSIPLPSPPAALGPEAMRLSLLISNPVAHSTMMCTREVLREAGGYNDCLAEDYELWLRLALRLDVKLHKSGLPLIALRRHAGQVTRNQNWSSRATSQPEWQRAYLELAQLVIAGSWDNELRSEVDASPSASDKARVLSNHLRTPVHQLPFPDRVFVQRLASKNGVVLSAATAKGAADKNG